MLKLPEVLLFLFPLLQKVAMSIEMMALEPTQTAIQYQIAPAPRFAKWVAPPAGMVYALSLLLEVTRYFPNGEREEQRWREETVSESYLRTLGNGKHGRNEWCEVGNGGGSSFVQGCELIGRGIKAPGALSASGKGTLIPWQDTMDNETDKHSSAFDVYRSGQGINPQAFHKKHRHPYCGGDWQKRMRKVPIRWAWELNSHALSYGTRSNETWLSSTVLEHVQSTWERMRVDESARRSTFTVDYIMRCHRRLIGASRQRGQQQKSRHLQLHYQVLQCQQPADAPLVFVRVRDADLSLEDKNKKGFHHNFSVDCYWLTGYQVTFDCYWVTEYQVTFDCYWPANGVSSHFWLLLAG